jgi:hypothetical protein
VSDADRRPVGFTATVRHRAGLGAIGWILLVLAILVAVGYASGLFT